MADLTDEQQAALIKQQQRRQQPHDDLAHSETENTLLKMENREILRVHKKEGLTELASKFLFDDLLNKAYDEVDQLALVRIDLNQFKKVNDQYGHEAGDNVLVRVGSYLKTLHHGDIPAIRSEVPNFVSLGSTITAARMGGDEFALLITGHSKEDAIHVTDEARKAIASIDHGIPNDVSGSVGLTWYDAAQGKPALKDLIAMADDASYAAKRQEGHPLCVANSLTEFYRVDDHLNLVPIATPNKVIENADRREAEVQDRRQAVPPTPKPPKP